MTCYTVIAYNLNMGFRHEDRFSADNPNEAKELMEGKLILFGNHISDLTYEYFVESSKES